MKNGVKQLEYVIISHPHKDHIDDILNFDKLSPRVILHSNCLKEEDVMDDIREEDKKILKNILK